MKVSDVVAVGSDAVADAFFDGCTLRIFPTEYNGRTIVCVEGHWNMQVSFDSRNAAIKFVKDAAHGMPMQYTKRTNPNNGKVLVRVRLSFMDGWATLNTECEGF